MCTQNLDQCCSSTAVVCGILTYWVCDDPQDATANDVPSDLFDVKGFPTLYFRTATGENIRYDGNRSKADLSKFIKKHRTTALETAGSTGEGGDAKDEL